MKSMTSFRATMLRMIHRRRLTKLQKVDHPLRPLDHIQVDTESGSTRFVYLGKGQYLRKRERAPRLIISGPGTLKDFLI